MFKNESAQSQGIDTTRLFRVTNKESVHFGELLRVIKFNNNHCYAYFKILSSGQMTFFYWTEVEYAKKSLDTLEVGDVLVDRCGYERVILGICGNIYFLSKIVDFEYVDKVYTLQEIKDDGWNLKGVKSGVIEITIDEVAAKFGKKPKEIRIKE